MVNVGMGKQNFFDRHVFLSHSGANLLQIPARIDYGCSARLFAPDQ